MVEKVLAVIPSIPHAIIALLRDFGIGIIAGIISGIISGYLVYYSLQKKKQKHWAGVKDSLESEIFKLICERFLYISMLLSIKERPETMEDKRARVEEFISLFKSKVMPGFDTKYKTRITQWSPDLVKSFVDSSEHTKQRLENLIDRLFSFTDYVKPSFLKGTIQAKDACASVKFIRQGLVWAFGEEPDRDVYKVRKFFEELTSATEKLLA